MKKRRVLVFVILFAALMCVGRVVSADEYTLHCYELTWCPATSEHCTGAVIDYDWCQIKCTQIDHSIKYVECERPSGK